MKINIKIKLAALSDLLPFITVVTILCLIAFIFQKACIKHEPIQEIKKFKELNYLAEQKVIKKSIVPFKKSIPKTIRKIAPIPAKKIKQIIEVELPKQKENLPEKIILFVDDRGFTFKAKDTSEEIKITQIHIRPSPVGFKFNFGVGVAPELVENKTTLQFSPIFTFSVVKIYDFYLAAAVKPTPFIWLGVGLEYYPWKFGVGDTQKTIRIGFGLYYRILELKTNTSKIIFAVGVKL